MIALPPKTLRYSLIVVIAAVLWIVAAYHLGSEPRLPSGAETARELEWSVPSLVNRTERDQAHKKLLALQPWGKEGAKNDKNAKGKTTQSTQWRFCGVARTSERQFALIEADGKVQSYNEGAVLPKGELLNKILDGAIEVKSQDETQIVRLYEAAVESKN
jgi:hypothetical protein